MLLSRAPAPAPLQVLDWEDTCGRCEQVEVAAHLALLGVGPEPMGRLVQAVGLNDLQVGNACMMQADKRP